MEGRREIISFSIIAIKTGNPWRALTRSPRMSNLP
jgi:hypothetical protein